jgi:hypothetical protein
VSERRATTLLALLLAAIAALLLSAPGRGYWVIDPDAAAYVGLARSLVSGDGYTLQGVPHAKFPPGFPCLLALAIEFTGDRECYSAMRDLVAAFGVIGVLLAFLVARRVLAFAPGPALFVAFSSAVSIYLLQYSVAYLRSETFFTAGYLAALLAAESWRTRRGFGGAIACGVACALAVSVRSAGLAAIAGIAAARMIVATPQGRLRIDFAPRTLVQVALMGLLGIAPMLAQKHYVASRSSEPGVASSDYGDELLARHALDLTKNVDEAKPRIEPFSVEMAQRVHGNLGSLALSLGKFVANHHKGANLAVGSRSGALHPGGYALLALLAVGLVIAARRGLVVAVATSVVYLALYLIWPFDQQQRFYQPIACLLLPFLALAGRPVLGFALRVANAPRGRFALGFAALVVAGFMASVESDTKSVLGRWSTVYAAMIGAAAAAGLAAIGSAFVRALDRVDLAAKTRLVANCVLTGLSILWVGSFLSSLREMHQEHRAFLADRARHPVSAPFAKIKTNPQLIELLERMLAEARPGDLVMSDIPKMIHEMTGLRTTPLRFDSERRILVLDTPQGRPTLLYHSPEIPRVCEIVARYIEDHASEFAALHRVVITEGSITIPLALYRIVPLEPK